LSDNKVGDESAITLTTLPNLEHLRLAKDDVSDHSAETISVNITSFNKTKYQVMLALEENPRLTNVGIELLQSNPKIELWLGPESN
jgi:hypothetical protein